MNARKKIKYLILVNKEKKSKSSAGCMFEEKKNREKEQMEKRNIFSQARNYLK